MKFEFVTSRDFNIVEALAEKIGIKADNSRIEFKGAMGRGFMKMMQLGPAFQMVLFRFCLKEELIIQRKPLNGSRKLVTVAFYLRDQPLVLQKYPDGGRNSGTQLSSVHVTSTNLEMVTRFAAGTDAHSTVVVLSLEMLVELLQTKKETTIFKTITSDSEPFSFETSMTPEIQNVLKQIDHAYAEGYLDDTFYKLKAQELTYLFFTDLIKERRQEFRKINKVDIQKAYLVKDAVLSDLSVQPTLARLAEMACVSESKLKQLFRQVFGKSIYNYYQIARMNEAAVLLKEFSVSETGYKLGFVSMSHFSKLFEKYQGVTPQKFRNFIKSNDRLPKLPG